MTAFLTAAVFALAIAVDPATVALSGRVIDQEGRVVPGASVVIAGASAAPIVTTTDGEGRYRVDVPPGRYRASASAPGLSGEVSEIVAAETDTSIDIVVHLTAIHETLVVSASQIDQPLSRTPDSVTVITGDDLRARQVSTLGAALRVVPGFTVAQTGGPGTQASLFPRGGESDYTLVLVDGVRANSFGGGVDLSQVPLENIDRIEIVRGPQSALYGSDAIGGVVHVITRRSGTPTADGRIEGGSREARRAAGSTAGEIGAWRWQAAGDYYEDRGFTGRAANGEIVGNDDAQARQASGGLGWRHARGTDVQSTFRYVDTDRGTPGPYGSDPAGRFAGVDRIARGVTYRGSAGLTVLQPWFGPASRVRQRVEVDSASYRLGFTDAFGRSDAGTRRTHVRVQTDAGVSSAVSASGGVEWIGERATSTFITSADGRIPVDRTMLGTFGEVRWTGHPRLTLVGGVRAERIRRDALAGDPFAFQPRPDFPADTVVSVNPKVAASWLLTSTSPGAGARQWTRVRGAVGTGIRPPDALEVAFTDNPGLKPERSRSAEIGLTQAFGGGAVQVDFTAFFNDYDDLIIAVGGFERASAFRTDNISNARSRGLELSGAWRPRAALDVRASYTFLSTDVLAVDDGDGEAPPPYRVGDPLLRRPRHQAALDARWTAGRVSTFGEAILRGATLDAEPTFGPTGGLFENPGYAVIHVGASVRLVRGVDLYGRITNLFDRSYEEVLGYPAPGRLAFIGVRLAASR